MTLLQCWLVLCVIMSVRETSDDVYDEDYHTQHVLKRFVVNLAMWHYWFVIDCVALWNARGGVKDE